MVTMIGATNETSHGATNGKEPLECHCCQGPHRLKKCPRFYQDFNNKQRRELLEKAPVLLEMLHL